MDVPDARELDRRLKDYAILQEMDKAKDQRIANLERELDLVKRETDLQERIGALKDKEIKILQDAFNRETIITEKALALAQIGKPSSNFQLYGLAAVAVFLAGFLLGR